MILKKNLLYHYDKYILNRIRIMYTNNLRVGNYFKNKIVPCISETVIEQKKNS